MPARLSRILAIDTALDCCSVAVLDTDSGAVWAQSEPMLRGHSERLMPMIGEVLSKAGTVYAQIDAIAVTVGPGAFTGLRIGLSTARALGLALDCPVVGIKTFDVLQCQCGEDCIVFIDTKRTDYYVRIHDSESVMTGLEIHEKLRGQKATIAGDGLIRMEGEEGFDPAWNIRRDIRYIDPDFLARMASEIIRSGVDIPVPEPVYLRGADVSQSKRVQRSISAE